MIDSLLIQVIAALWNERTIWETNNKWSNYGIRFQISSNYVIKLINYSLIQHDYKAKGYIGQTS